MRVFSWILRTIRLAAEIEGLWAIVKWIGGPFLMGGLTTTGFTIWGTIAQLPPPIIGLTGFGGFMLSLVGVNAAIQLYDRTKQANGQRKSSKKASDIDFSKWILQEYELIEVAALWEGYLPGTIAPQPALLGRLKRLEQAAQSGDLEPILSLKEAMALQQGRRIVSHNTRVTYESLMKYFDEKILEEPKFIKAFKRLKKNGTR